MKYLIFALIVLLTGCILNLNKSVAEEDFTCDGSFYTPEEGFTESEEVQIQIAVVRLNDWLGFDATKVADVGKCLMRNESLEPPLGGTWDGSQIRIDVAKIHQRFDKFGSFNAVLQVVVMHELLHSLGMGHHEGPGVMNPIVGFEFTDEDRVQCKKDLVCK